MVDGGQILHDGWKLSRAAESWRCIDWMSYALRRRLVQADPDVAVGFAVHNIGHPQPPRPLPHTEGPPLRRRRR